MATTVESNLFDHGILGERSDIRAHVGVRARIVYAFKTPLMQKYISDNRIILKEGIYIQRYPNRRNDQ